MHSILAYGNLFFHIQGKADIFIDNLPPFFSEFGGQIDDGIVLWQPLKTSFLKQAMANYSHLQGLVLNK